MVKNMGTINVFCFSIAKLTVLALIVFFTIITMHSMITTPFTIAIQQEMAIGTSGVILSFFLLGIVLSRELC